MRRCALALAVAAAALLGSALPAEASWSPQTSGTTNNIRDVACPAVQHCYGVGAAGTILATTDGGATWTPQSSGTTALFYDIACPSESTCYAVGDLGMVRKTTNSGASWAAVHSGGSTLFSISCPGTSNCVAVGDTGTIIGTTDGGSTWVTHNSGTTTSLFGVACPNTSLCYAVGDNGVIRAKAATTNTWNGQASSTSYRLDGISCPTATSCLATGGAGAIVKTDTAGAVWTTEPTPYGYYWFDVDCPTADVCYAVGSAGTAIGSVNGGTTWDPEDTNGTTPTLTGVACPTADTCKAVGDTGVILTRGGTATGHSSADCDSVTGAQTVLDGYAGDAYVRVKTARPSPEHTWVCYRVDNGTSIRQGGLIDVDTDVHQGLPSVDNQADACSTSTNNVLPGPHPLVNAAIGDPNDPPYVPIMVDALRHNEAVWVCLRAGGQQLRASVITPDVELPTVTTFVDGATTPPPDDPPAGLPSSTCQTSSGKRVLNTDVSNSHVWLYTLQPALNEADVCVRVQGPLSVGGELGVKAQVGIPLRVTTSSDTSPCTTDVLNVTSPVQLRVARTPTSNTAQPSVCVDQGGTHERVTADTTGSLVLPAVTWAPDPGTP